jgi:DNA recombination protein RmuC
MEDGMSAGILQVLLLLLIAAGAGVAAISGIVCARKLSVAPSLSKESAAALLRSETDIIRATIQDEARCLRQEVGQSLTSFQEMTLTTFGALRDGIDGQVRSFGERLDGGLKAIDGRAAAISAKLNDDIAQMRSEASANRESLRTAIEQRLDQNIGLQTEGSKTLRDELGGNFQRLGSRVSDSLGEASRMQKERLDNVTSAVFGLSEKLEKGQESLRVAVEGRLDAIRQENATKLDEMRKYLLHKSHFAKVRKLLLDNSETIVQDDSGIPLVYFEPRRWKFLAFGHYQGPISIFPNTYQPRMAELF